MYCITMLVRQSTRERLLLSVFTLYLSDFSQCLDRNFLCKKNPIKLLHYLKFSAIIFTWTENQFKRFVQQWVLMQVSTVSEYFSWIHGRKLWKNMFPWPLLTLRKKFTRLHKQQKWTGLGTPHYVAWRNSWEHFGVRSVLDRFSGQGFL